MVWLVTEWFRPLGLLSMVICIRLLKGSNCLDEWRLQNGQNGASEVCVVAPFRPFSRLRSLFIWMFITVCNSKMFFDSVQSHCNLIIILPKFISRDINLHVSKSITNTFCCKNVINCYLGFQFECNDKGWRRLLLFSNCMRTRSVPEVGVRGVIVARATAKAGSIWRGVSLCVAVGRLIPILPLVGPWAKTENILFGKKENSNQLYSRFGIVYCAQLVQEILLHFNWSIMIIPKLEHFLLLLFYSVRFSMCFLI